MGRFLVVFFKMFEKKVLMRLLLELCSVVLGIDFLKIIMKFVWVKVVEGFIWFMLGFGLMMKFVCRIVLLVLMR